MQSNDVEMIDQDEEIFDFLQEICARYHLGRQSAQFDQKAFIDWVVVQAGMLYIRYVLQPQGGNC